MVFKSRQQIDIKHVQEIERKLNLTRKNKNTKEDEIETLPRFSAPCFT